MILEIAELQLVLTITTEILTLVEDLFMVVVEEMPISSAQPEIVFRGVNHRVSGHVRSQIEHCASRRKTQRVRRTFTTFASKASLSVDS